MYSVYVWMGSGDTKKSINAVLAEWMVGSTFIGNQSSSSPNFYEDTEDIHIVSSVKQTGHYITWKLKETWRACFS